MKNKTFSGREITEEMGDLDGVADGEIGYITQGISSEVFETFFHPINGYN